MTPEPPYRARRWQSLHDFIYKYGMFGIVIIMFSLLTYNQYMVLNQKEEAKSMRAYGYDFDSDLKAEGFTGIYFPECGYFVDTRRSMAQINRTEYHEACHALIQQTDRGHFCETD